LDGDRNTAMLPVRDSNRRTLHNEGMVHLFIP